MVTMYNLNLTLSKMSCIELCPFRMCAVFSTAENEDASISFEDFLDMASGS